MYLSSRHSAVVIIAPVSRCDSVVVLDLLKASNMILFHIDNIIRVAAMMDSELII